MNALIKVAIANLHAEPNIQSEIADEALYGMPVEIIEHVDENWAKIRTFYRYEGYCLKENIDVDEALKNTWIEQAKHVVIQSFADVLVSPIIQSEKMITLPRGAFIQVIEDIEVEKGWTKVRLVTGEIGYVRSMWVQERTHVYTLNQAVFREQVVETAFSYLGTPYRWGGKTPAGIDCSGLCSMAYMFNGAYIYRDAKIIDGFPLKAIDQKDMQRGDLLFFPEHVAMYIGDDCYIHSSLGGNEVNVNSLNPKHENYREDLATTITGVGSLF